MRPPARAREAGDRGGGDGPGGRGPSPSTASTTAYYLALQLRRKRELVVVTNGLLIASALAEAPGVSVVVTSGILRRATLSVVRGLAGDLLRTTGYRQGLLRRARAQARARPDGPEPGGGPPQARSRSRVRPVVGIFDHRKWSRTALLAFSPPERVSAIVTDDEALPELLDAWRARGVTVETVEPEQPGRERPALRPRALREAAATERA